jgi:hypothetical protein
MNANFRVLSLVTATLVAALACTSRASADLVKNLATGVDAQGNLLPNFTLDPSFSITGPGGVAYLPQARTQGSLPNTYILDNAMPGSRWDYFVNNPPTNGDVFVPWGNYLFTTTVNLNGFNPATAFIQGLQVSTDNAILAVAVNGTTVFTHTPVPDPFIEEFKFVLNVGDIGLGAFQAGLNTITFTLYNGAFLGFDDGPSPAAFRALGSVQASPITTAAPEPASLVLVSVGILAVIGYRRRRQA